MHTCNKLLASGMILGIRPLEVFEIVVYTSVCSGIDRELHDIVLCDVANNIVANYLKSP